MSSFQGQWQLRRLVDSILARRPQRIVLSSIEPRLSRLKP